MTNNRFSDKFDYFILAFGLLLAYAFLINLLKTVWHLKHRNEFICYGIVFALYFAFEVMKVYGRSVLVEKVENN